jgi:hypothetical protein
VRRKLSNERARNLLDKKSGNRGRSVLTYHDRPIRAGQSVIPQHALARSDAEGPERWIERLRGVASASA